MLCVQRPGSIVSAWSGSASARRSRGAGAQRRTDVAAIIAIAPVVDGRRYARELRALAATSAVDAYTNGGTTRKPRASR